MAPASRPCRRTGLRNRLAGTGAVFSLCFSDRLSWKIVERPKDIAAFVQSKAYRLAYAV